MTNLRLETTSSFYQAKGIPFTIPFNKENTNPLIQKLYLQFLISRGSIPFYRFNAANNTWVHSSNNIEVPFPPDQSYAFVILHKSTTQSTEQTANTRELTANGLELRIGTTNHCLLALGNTLDDEIKREIELLNKNRMALRASPNGILKFSQGPYNHNMSYINQLAKLLGEKIDQLIKDKTPAVVAAGDLTVSQGQITRINDQSGGFNVCPSDPDFNLKRISIMTAMQAFGLHMDRFVPVLPNPPIPQLTYSYGSQRSFSQEVLTTTNQSSQKETLPAFVSV